MRSINRTVHRLCSKSVTFLSPTSSTSSESAIAIHKPSSPHPQTSPSEYTLIASVPSLPNATLPNATKPVSSPRYAVAMHELTQDKTLKAETELRQCKYLNNMIEQDHRNVKHIVKPIMEFQSFNTARRTLCGIEAMAMLRKGQVKGISQGDSVSQARFINELFGVRA